MRGQRREGRDEADEVVAGEEAGQIFPQRGERVDDALRAREEEGLSSQEGVVRGEGLSGRPAALPPTLAHIPAARLMLAPVAPVEAATTPVPMRLPPPPPERRSPRRPAGHRGPLPCVFIEMRII